MKTIFENLKKEVKEVNRETFYHLIEEFTDFLIKNQNEDLLSVGKGWSGYGTWKSSSFVNEFEYGDELKEILTRAIDGTVTHDEEKVFKLSDFQERIEEEIAEYLHHLEEEEE